MTPQLYMCLPRKERRLYLVSVQSEKEKSQFLKDVIPNALEVFTQMVSEKMGVLSEEVRGNLRHRKLSEPRQLVMYLLRKYTDFTLKEIGNYMGKRHHTTVLYNIQQVEALYFSSKEYREKVSDILKMF